MSASFEGATIGVDFGYDPDTPRTGMDLVKRLGCAADEGVVVAILPERVEEITTREIPYLNKHGEYMHVVEMESDVWGMRVLDVVDERNTTMKWWQVKMAVRQEGLELVPIRWEGPIGEIPEKYFEAKKDGSRPVLAIRFYQHGPWFWPLEKPVQAKDEAINEVIEEAVTDGRS